MNTHGASGTTGLKADEVTAFLDAHRVTVVRSGKRRQTINGYLTSANDSRVIRRWRNDAKGVTRSAAARVFGNHGLTLTDYKRWLAKRR